jgi:RimJ/RimL family protein N-acetyltransferase
LDAAFATGRRRIWSTVRSWNGPSVRVLEKLGSNTTTARWTVEPSWSGWCATADQPNPIRGPSCDAELVALRIEHHDVVQLAVERVLADRGRPGGNQLSRFGTDPLLA